jgi:hypothetical protein
MTSRPSNPIRVANVARGSLWTFLPLALLSTALPATADLRITRDGESDYRIVIPADAIPSESYAARELQSYLAKISGANLLIVKDSEPEGRHEIVLGTTTRDSLLGARGNFGRPGLDGFEIVTAGDRLFIRGGRPRGTLYGVYTLLEEKLGVRWFTPEVELAPTNRNIHLPDLDETKAPALESRDVFWREMMRDADFAARHRLNGQHYSLTEKQGGPFTVYHPFVHSFDLLIPPSLFAEHPEYFP